MHYPVWIHCFKRPNYDFCILQDNIATVLRWGAQNYNNSLQVSSWCKKSKIIKISRCFTKLFKNKSGTCLWTTVCNVSFIEIPNVRPNSGARRNKPVDYAVCGDRKCSIGDRGDSHCVIIEQQNHIGYSVRSVIISEWRTVAGSDSLTATSMNGVVVVQQQSGHTEQLL